MQYLEHIYNKKIHGLAEIKNLLGVLHFIWDFLCGQWHWGKPWLEEMAFSEESPYPFSVNVHFAPWAPARATGRQWPSVTLLRHPHR